MLRGHGLRSPGVHLHPVGQLELHHRIYQEVDPPLPAVDQEPGRRREHHGQDQAGNPAATPEVDAGAGGRQGSGERPGVVDVVVDRPGPEKAQLTGGLEDLPNGSER